MTESVGGIGNPGNEYCLGDVLDSSGQVVGEFSYMDVTGRPDSNVPVETTDVKDELTGNYQYGFQNRGDSNNWPLLDHRSPRRYRNEQQRFEARVAKVLIFTGLTVVVGAGVAGWHYVGRPVADFIQDVRELDGDVDDSMGAIAEEPYVMVSTGRDEAPHVVESY